MRIIFTCLLLLLSLSPAIAQEDFVYGQPSDLKGMTRLYVDTGTNTKARDSIIKELAKSKLEFNIVDDSNEAEIVLGFGAGLAAKRVVTTGVVSQVVEVRTGSGLVFVNARGKVRLVLSFEDTQNSRFERNPASNFVREFIKAYKKGNDLK